MPKVLTLSFLCRRYFKGKLINIRQHFIREFDRYVIVSQRDFDLHIWRQMLTKHCHYLNGSQPMEGRLLRNSSNNNPAFLDFFAGVID